MLFWNMIRILVLLFLNFTHFAFATTGAKALFDEIVYSKYYDKNSRPVANNANSLNLTLGLKLSQIMDVDEKNQVVTTSLWLEQEWYDFNWVWDPDKYGGIKMLHVPVDKIWYPDLVLYNNADGDYQVTIPTKAIVYYNGTVKWEPPVIYKSFCEIEIEYFPFDTQVCYLKIGSWTHHNGLVVLFHKNQQNGTELDDVVLQRAMDMSEYIESVEWDILEIDGKRWMKFYPCCPAEPYPHINFNYTMRRKTLFYTVNLMIPCMSISFLTLLVFYLPADSGEKITLSISILISLTVFFLLLSEIIPNTSRVIPLIGKYIMFTMILVTFSIWLSVVVLNIRYRSDATHEMGPWVKMVFLKVLPRILLMARPSLKDSTQEVKSKRKSQRRTSEAHFLQTQMLISADVETDSSSGDEATNTTHLSASDQVMKAIKDIVKHLKGNDDSNNISEDWKFVAMVIDRFFLWVFSIVCFAGTAAIILQAPSLYDTRPALNSQNTEQLVPDVQKIVYSHRVAER